MPTKQRVARWAICGAICAASLSFAQAQETVSGVVLAENQPAPPPPEDVAGEVAAENAAYNLAQITPPRIEENIPAPPPSAIDDGRGLRLRSFVLTGLYEAGADYTDNVFASATNQRSDRIYTLNTSLALQSDWVRHSLRLSLESARTFFEKNPSEDTVTLNTQGQLRIDIRRDTTLDLRTGFVLDQEARGSVDLNANAASPTDIYRFNASATLNKRFNRMTMRLRGGFQSNKYDDTPLSNGTIEDNSDRNNYEVNTVLRVGYDVSPRLGVFSELTYAKTVYDRKVDNNGDIRGSQTYGANAGVNVEFSGLLNGEFSLGYRQATFEDSGFGDVDALVANAAFTWAPSQLTVVTANLSTDLGQTTLSGSSGSVQRSASLSVTHAWRENIDLNARAAIDYEDFNEISLNETTYNLSFGIDYDIGRNLTLGARYRYQKFDSSAAGADYDVNTVGVRLTYAD